MKIRKNAKKGQTGLLLFPTLAFMLALIVFFTFMTPNIKDFIGGKQAAVISAVGKGEQELSAIDTSARLAAWQSIFMLGEKGGFYSEQLGDDETGLSPEKYPCNRYVYTLWNTGDGKCIPNPVEAYKQFFDKNLKNNYLISLESYDFSGINYAYNVQIKGGKTIISGKADDIIRIPISYDITSAIPPSEAEGAMPIPTAYEGFETGFLPWPVQSNTKVVASGYGERNTGIAGASSNHPGLDIAAAFNTPIIAVADGVVSNYYDGDGALEIDHQNGFKTLYAHLDSTNVNVGDSVKQGQVIGLSGRRGEFQRFRWDPHLHFEIAYAAVPDDLRYGSQSLSLSSFGTRKRVQPLCFFDPTTYTLQQGMSNGKKPVNTELDKVCALYNFPTRFEPGKPGVTASRAPTATTAPAITTSSTAATVTNQGLYQVYSDMKKRFGLADAEPAIIVDGKEQKLYLVNGINQLTILKTYPVSTAKNGFGMTDGSLMTPLGIHRIKTVIGAGSPIGTVLNSAGATSQVATIYKDSTNVPEDLVTTRLMWLDGVEASNSNSYSRFIYIHGTPEEGLIGTPQSHGCVRMKNDDVVELFSLVKVGTYVDIVNGVPAGGPAAAATAAASGTSAAEAKTPEMKLSHPTEADAYARVLSYRDIIAKAAKENNAPQAMIEAIIFHESKGYANAVNSYVDKTGGSAVGFGQFLHDTAVDKMFKSVFSTGLANCGCVGGSGPVPFCTRGHNCPANEPRLDPEKSINAIAIYIAFLQHHYAGYTTRDGFTFIAYFQGLGATDQAIAKAKSRLNNDDPDWKEVVPFFGTPSKKEDIKAYGDDTLNLYLDFGGASISTTTSYQGPAISLKETRVIGTYNVNPSFTTEVNYDLNVYGGLEAWANATYNKCNNIQQKLHECVDGEVANYNNKYKDCLPDDKKAAATTASTEKPPFCFDQVWRCDSKIGMQMFNTIAETVEDCIEFGNSGCSCQLPRQLLDSRTETLTITANWILYEDTVNNKKYYYDLTSKNISGLKYNDKTVKSIVIKQKDGTDYEVQFTDGTSESLNTAKNPLLLINDRSVPAAASFKFATQAKAACVFQKHNFRFCAIANDLLPTYDASTKQIAMKQVPIKFALDLAKAPPPAIAQPAVKTAGAAGSSPFADASKQCKDAGKAKIELQAVTKDVKADYDKFALSFISQLLPQSQIINLFLTSFLQSKDLVPATIAVKIDTNNVAKGCDIIGIVYKCGLGTPAYSNGGLDLNEPNGFVDLSSYFKSTGLKLSPDSKCIDFKNPDGSATKKQVRYLNPSIDNDLLSFAVTQCDGPVAQFKKGWAGILSSFSPTYYISFAYVDSAYNYGPATFKLVEVPGVTNQLLGQLGQLSSMPSGLASNTNFIGSPLSLFDQLGLSDEWSFLRRALAKDSLGTMLPSISTDASQGAYKRIAQYIPDDAGRQMFDIMAQGGKLSFDTSSKVVSLISKGLSDVDTSNIISQLATEPAKYAKDAYNFISGLSIDRKRSLLEALYPKDKVAKMSDTEVNQNTRSSLLDASTFQKIMNALNPQERTGLISQLSANSPDDILSIMGKVLGDAKKTDAIKQLLNMNVDPDLSKILAGLAPDQAIKAGMSYITSQPGLGSFTDYFKVRSDLGTSEKC